MSESLFRRLSEAEHLRHMRVEITSEPNLLSVISVSPELTRAFQDGPCGNSLAGIFVGFDHDGKSSNRHPRTIYRICTPHKVMQPGIPTAACNPNAVGTSSKRQQFMLENSLAYLNIVDRRFGLSTLHLCRYFPLCANDGDPRLLDKEFQKPTVEHYSAHKKGTVVYTLFNSQCGTLYGYFGVRLEWVMGQFY